jgi:tetratricopeptide (TPR) repeat protein
MNALATNMARQQKFQEAEALYTDLLTLYARDFGDDSIEYGELIYNLGAVHLQLQKFDDAEGCFAAAKTIFAEKLGEDHDRTREVENQLAEIRHLIYERDQAMKCCAGCVIA